MPTGKLKSRRLAFTSLLTVGWDHERPAFGVMLACMKKHGLYVHGQADLKSLSVDGECRKDGSIPSTGDTPYYTGSEKYSRYAFLAGGIHSIASLCYLYEGVGYGKRQVAWETIEGLKLRNKDYSYKGIAAELGLLVKVRKMALTLGVITIKGEYWEPTVGVGINF